MQRLERHQVALCLGAIAAAAAAGLLAPMLARGLEVAITPTLGLLLFATFLGVPFGRIAGALRERRFLVAVLALNFFAVPLVVFVLSRFVAADAALLAGVLLVLLTPCVDYVLVFAGLAGGDRERLLAATPLLMVLQIVLLPAYLSVLGGAELLDAWEVAPFVEAFLLLIAVPLALAAAAQLLARRFRPARALESAAAAAMVPLLCATLAVVVASQVARVGGALGTLLAVVPLFLAFAVLAVPLGVLFGRVAGLDVPGRRALVFSGVTRNSLVVLPLALALPPAFSLTPLVVVTQTLVELVVMVALVALAPRLVR